MKTIFLSCLFLILFQWAGQSFAQDLSGGDVVGRNIFGLATDYNGDPLLIEDRPLIHKTSRFNEQVILGTQTFLVSGFNHQIGSVYVTYLDSKTHNPVDTSPLGLSSIGGLSNPGAGFRTPWGSVLLAEGGIIDGANAEAFTKNFKAYYKGKANLVNPYNYGWLSEVIVLDADGQAKAIKNYAMGRVFANQVVVMPDSKTVYLLDSQSSGNLYVFIADQPYSMVKGSLYAISRKDRHLSYTLLGKTSALKLKFQLKKIAFDSLFKKKEAKNKHCPAKYTYINTVYGEECLSLKKKGKKYAGVFEPIRVSALKGIPGLGKNINSMQFDTDKKQLRFKHTDGNDFAFPVSEDQKLHSQFIIKEPS